MSNYIIIAPNPDTGDLEPVSTGTDAAQHRLKEEIARLPGARTRRVSREWWERYVSAREAFRALEREYRAMPELTVKWFAQVSADGEAFQTLDMPVRTANLWQQPAADQSA